MTLALNKKEQAELAALKQEVRIARALRWTDPVQRDLPPPTRGGTVSQGWDYSDGRWTVQQAWSSSVYHGYGEYVSKGHCAASQNPRALFSTEELALQALRNAAEREFAEQLA